MNIHLIILVLAVVGVLEAIYLLIQRKKKRPPVCVIGGSCTTVWESPYSMTFGVGNEVLGIIFYSTVAILEAVLILGAYDPILAIGEWVILVGGSVMSAYYIYLQWRVIRAWCFWCTISALIVWVMVAVRAFIG